MYQLVMIYKVSKFTHFNRTHHSKILTFGKKAFKNIQNTHFILILLIFNRKILSEYSKLTKSYSFQISEEKSTFTVTKIYNYDTPLTVVQNSERESSYFFREHAKKEVPLERNN